MEILSYKTKKDASHVCRDIVWARKSLKLGDGFSINPWMDLWVRSLNGFVPSPKEGHWILLFLEELVLSKTLPQMIGIISL